MSSNIWKLFTVFSHHGNDNETDTEIPAHKSHRSHHPENLWPNILVRMLEKRNLKTKTRIILESSSKNSRYTRKSINSASQRDPNTHIYVTASLLTATYRTNLDDHQGRQIKCGVQVQWNCSHT